MTLLTLLLLECLSSRSPHPLAFHLTPRGAIIGPAVVNGSGPYPFLLDTGSNRSIVSEDLASALHLPIVARTTLASGAAQKDTLVAGIEHLGIGDVTNGALIATIASRDDLTFPDLTADGTRIQGVIGQDVLASLRYTIDYRHRQIVWRPDRSGIPPRATVLALDFQEDRFLALIPADRDVVRLVPDTGAERLVLFRTDRPSSIDVTLTGEPVAVVAMAGARAARTAIVRTLRLGSTTLTNVTAVVVDREHNAPAVDGLLPLHLFARVTFDGPGRQLYIEAR